jgi:hypothetical protein
MDLRRGLTITLLLLILAVAGCEGEPAADTDEPGRETTSRTAPPVHFYREYVIVEPSERTCRVDGLYFMRNVSGRALELTIEYPFPVGSRAGYPYQIFLEEVTDEGERAMGFTRGERSIRFPLRFGPDDERRFRVRYAQQVRGGSATYIVTTTKRWERPIELAEFEIRIPPGMDGVVLSVDPDSTWARGDTTVHYLRETDFFPDEDIVVRWED